MLKGRTEAESRQIEAFVEYMLFNENGRQFTADFFASGLNLKEVPKVEDYLDKKEFDELKSIIAAVKVITPMPSITLRGLEPCTVLTSDYHNMSWCWYSKGGVCNSLEIIYDRKSNEYTVLHLINDLDAQYDKDTRVYKKFANAVKYLRKLGRRINKKRLQR